MSRCSLHVSCLFKSLADDECLNGLSVEYERSRAVVLQCFTADGSFKKVRSLKLCGDTYRRLCLSIRYSRARQECEDVEVVRAGRVSTHAMCSHLASNSTTVSYLTTRPT